MPGSVDVLVLVAHRLELSGFGDALAIAAGATVSPLTELHGVRVAAAEVGVGLPAAGGGTARALAAVNPRAAVLLGSFGAFTGANALAIGTLLVPDELRAIDAATLRGHAALPSAMPHTAACDRALAAGLAQSAPNAARAPLATTLAITTDDALAHSLGERSGCCGENLEGIAVALACTAAAVPFAALLACTNEVGTRGRAQWAAGHRAAAHATAAALITWLGAGAPGLPRS